MLFTILGCSLVTWFLRVTPFIILQHFHLPKLVLDFLNFVPIAIMAGLWIESLLIRQPGQLPAINWLNLGASIPAFLTVIISRNLLITVIVGVIGAGILQMAF
ncbi:AzlD domain-containing protein [Liquorilactobacillus vini]|uniref:AzlD domain-containing protein n=1 Tax=Liquorilactobacillus vini TaxID=238015 RepID=UPI002E20BD66